MKLDCLHIVWRGPFCLPRLVVHCVYPIWWSIAFTPFGGPLCLACDSTAVGTQTLKHVRDSATVELRFCDTTAVGTQTLKRVCASTAVGTHVVRTCVCIIDDVNECQKRYKTIMKSGLLVFWDLPNHQNH